MIKDIEKITYSEARYTYETRAKMPRGKNVSYGRIINKTDNYLDVELAWTENPHRTIFGIVIPEKTLGIKSKIDKDRYSIGDTVAVYWNDVFVYDDKYAGTHEPTSMITEGILLRETPSYILIGQPETLNLIDAINHPEKKPRRYYIPKSIIDEIRIVRKNKS